VNDHRLYFLSSLPFFFVRPFFSSTRRFPRVGRNYNGQLFFFFFSLFFLLAEPAVFTLTYAARKFLFPFFLFFPFFRFLCGGVEVRYMTFHPSFPPSDLRQAKKGKSVWGDFSSSPFFPQGFFFSIQTKEKKKETYHFYIPVPRRGERRCGRIPFFSVL